jgi:hypothetical protein
VADQKNGSPFSTHVHQRTLCLGTDSFLGLDSYSNQIFPIEIFDCYMKGNVREHVDCHTAYIPPVSSTLFDSGGAVVAGRYYPLSLCHSIDKTLQAFGNMALSNGMSFTSI